MKILANLQSIKIKKCLLTMAIICLAATFVPAQTNYHLDVKTSVINWTGHAEIGTYAPAGTLRFKDGNITTLADAISKADITIDMTTMNQANSSLLEHLKSDDFFGVLKYPESRIKITTITNGIAYGELTIKNKTLPFKCTLVIKKDNKQIIVTGNTVIDRTAYGIIYNSGNFFSGLGDKAIRNTFDIDFKIIAVTN